MDEEFLVKQTTRKVAQLICSRHPHAPSLPNSSKYYFILGVNRCVCGLAVWGYGILPKKTAGHLFKGGLCKVENYLELCRFFVYGKNTKNLSSRFLSITHKILKKLAPKVKVLYTYAAGFQGMVGTIYQAAGYDYIGKQKFHSNNLYIPGYGILHGISIWHRYKTNNFKKLVKIFPTAKTWGGYNYRYVYWLCSGGEKAKMLRQANFEIIKPYPKLDDIEIWQIDANGNKEIVDPAFAKTVPIVKLKTKRNIKRLKHSGDAVVIPNNRGRFNSDQGAVLK